MSKLKAFRQLPKARWPTERQPGNLKAVWISKDYLVQIYEETENVIRLSINCVKLKGSKWVDSITWDTMQAIKDAVGFENFWAVEVFPMQQELLNLANIRYLFVSPKKPRYAWSKRGST